MASRAELPAPARARDSTLTMLSSQRPMHILDLAPPDPPTSQRENSRLSSLMLCTKLEVYILLYHNYLPSNPVSL